MGLNPSSDPPIKYRVTLFSLTSNAATMLLLAPAPGAKLLSQILQRASNKFRMRAKRVFVAGSGVECGVENIEGVVRDGVKLVVSSGGKYELQTATGSPTIAGLTGGDSPLQVDRTVDNDGDEEGEGMAGGETGRDAVGSVLEGGEEAEGEELKMDALDIRSDGGSANLSLEDGKSEEGDGRVVFTSASPSPSHPSSVFSSLSATLAAIPSWLPSSRSRTPTTAHSTSHAFTPSPSVPIPVRSSASEVEKLSFSPSPSHSSSSSSSPTLVASSPVAPSHLLSLPPASSASPSAASRAASSSSTVAGVVAADDEAQSLLAENARLRDAVRGYDDKRRQYRRMESQLKQLQATVGSAEADKERIRELEGQVKDWSERYADSEERLGLQVRATDKAVREKEGLRAKHASVVERLGKAQQLKVELDAMTRQHREAVQELAELRGKNMEEKSLALLQGTLEYHQQMVVRLHSVIVARMDSERKLLQEKWQCKICFEREVDVVLQPCNHAVVCHRCGPLINCCPICRRTINIRTAMHLS